MKRRMIKLFMPALILLSIGSCKEESPLDSEQYFKVVYIVGADQTSNEGLRVIDVPYLDEGYSQALVSVATGGSLYIDRDIYVELKEVGSTPIDIYNFKFITDGVKYQHLADSKYDMSHNYAHIKAGEIYGTMPFGIETKDLHADSLYAMTFQIASISDSDYISIREMDTVLILNFNFVNMASGSYQMEGYYYLWENGEATGDSIEVSTNRVLTAISERVVRMYHITTVENSDNLVNYAITLTIAEDNSIAVASWGDLNVTGGGGTFDPEKKSIEFWYNYMDGSTEKQFSATMTTLDNDYGL